MYEAIKRLAKQWLPKKLLLKNELLLRKVYTIRFRGNKVGCNICDSKLSSFIQLENGELLCPACGSLPRNRRLWELLIGQELLKGNVLDFSPSRCLLRKMRAQKNIHYVSSDYAGEFEAEKSYDITAIAEPEGKFDLVICYHVLEHVENDHQAMAQLYRILRSGGNAVIQTPFKDGAIYEDSNISTSAARLAHFGQEDHVRVYSVNGLAERLQVVGFRVDIRHFDKHLTSDQFYGMKENETVLIASK